ncbi:D-alanyl-D-alanine carboxypeptidase family protein [Shimazuella kribbensis]|uniref:D-alanyl-D-alanine carboxypeptidase family protein n=1 Tax=Shimazuella kribbensis TaxID=139808 RepID=UPI00040F3B82|nr:D-alanyl-D-alanine carboxypeptidase family protein [Shimazuella kribbensis]
MKRWYLLFLIPVLLIAPLYVYANPPLAGSAQAAILMDRDSGRILFAKNADRELKIASLTKIMTALVAIEQSKLNSIVTVGPNAVGVEGSSIYLKKGEQIPLEPLLYGLMLRSGNDAATAIAEHVGGSVEGFVYLMNQKASFLGLEHTHFMNPHGLDQPDHYSSAKDLAILTSYALKNPTFRQIVKTQIKTIDWPNLEWDQKFYNKNKLLRLYPWADGVKTGFTKQARRTLVTSATKNGSQLVAVTLNDGNDWNDAIDMYNFGFANYHREVVLHQGQLLAWMGAKNKQNKELYMMAGKSFVYPLTKSEKAKIKIQTVQSTPTGSIQSDNQAVGIAKIYLEEELIGSIPILSAFRDKPTYLQQLEQVLSSVVTGVVKR